MSSGQESQIVENQGAFLSHSSQDKDFFVRPLAQCLEEHGATIWYDEYSMKPGDSLSASIDEGLSRAEFGIVVLSPNFISTAKASGWTRYELRGLVANSIGVESRRIVPIWLDVTPRDIREFSPPLADLLAINATAKQIDEVALEVMEIISPDRAEGLRRLRLAIMPKNAKVEKIPASELEPGPIVQRRVGGYVVLRALLITQTLADCGSDHASDLEGFLEDLSRDIHHEKELRTWEAIATSYKHGCMSFELKPSERHALYRLLLTATLGDLDEESIEILGANRAGIVLDHFRDCLDLASNEVLIGKRGFLGLLKSTGDSEGIK